MPHAVAGLTMPAGTASAQGAAPSAGDPLAPTGPTPSIVLVHGAFADARAWARVIPLLEGAGYPVVAVENPLTSFDADVATTRRAIDAQPGPSVAVGHSYGGAVITQAAAGSDKVRALVYVAADVPEAETRSMAATQKPIHGSAFQATLGAAAWRDRPSRPDDVARLIVDAAAAAPRVAAPVSVPREASHEAQDAALHAATGERP
jgi:pimeloyl-ACP methyl ester carboxylesterase